MTRNLELLSPPLGTASLVTAAAAPFVLALVRVPVPNRSAWRCNVQRNARAHQHRLTRPSLVGELARSGQTVRLVRTTLSIVFPGIRPRSFGWGLRAWFNARSGAAPRCASLRRAALRCAAPRKPPTLTTPALSLRLPGHSTGWIAL